MFAAALYTNRLHFDTVVAQSPLQVMNHVLHSFKRGTSRQSPSKNLLFFIYNGKSKSHCLTQTPWFHVPMFAVTLNVWSAGIQTNGIWDIRWEYMCSLSKNERRKEFVIPLLPGDVTCYCIQFHCCAIGGTLKRLREKKKSVVNCFLMMPARKVYLSSFCEVKIA